MLKVVKDEKTVFSIYKHSYITKGKTPANMSWVVFAFFFFLLVTCLHVFKNSFPQNLYWVFFSIWGWIDKRVGIKIL